jgi:flagellar hook protein FlgE
MLDGLSMIDGVNAFGQWYEAVRRDGNIPPLDQNRQTFETAANDASLPAVTVDGPGFFVLRDGARRIYTRTGNFHLSNDGYLEDDKGRQVLGYRDGSSLETAPTPILVARARVASGEPRATTTSQFRIGEDGALTVSTYGTATKTRGPIERTTVVARVCLAVFPSPANLTRAAEGTVAATALAGKPMLVRAGTANVGRIRPGPSEFDAQAVQRRLHDLWLASGKAALNVALAATADGFNRIALNLVK